MENNFNEILIFYIGLKKEDVAIELFKLYTNKTSLEAKSYLNKLEFIAKDELKDLRKQLKEATFAEKRTLEEEIKKSVDDEFLKKCLKDDVRLAIILDFYFNRKASISDSELYLKNLNVIDEATFEANKKIIKIDDSIYKETIQEIKKRTKIDNEETKEFKGYFWTCLVVGGIVSAIYLYYKNLASEGWVMLYSDKNKETVNLIFNWGPLIILGCIVGAIYFYTQWKKAE